MDRLYIRIYFVVAIAGMFSLLNTSVVSADVPNNAVSWFKFAPEVRTRFIQQEANIGQNRSDVAAIDARVDALLDVVTAQADQIADLQAQVADMEAGIVPNLGTYLRIGTHNGRPAALFEAVNVMDVNGTGSTVGATNR